MTAPYFQPTTASIYYLKAYTEVKDTNIREQTAIYLCLKYFLYEGLR